LPIIFFYGMGYPGLVYPDNPWGAPDGDSRNLAPAFSGDGYAWEGVFGAATTYPMYGIYADPYNSFPTWPTVTQTMYSPAYIVSNISPAPEYLVAQWIDAGVVLFPDGGSRLRGRAF
jgi:hypothetical protein